ncbi:MAG: hypothetical protein ABEJ65_06605 [bacterium]
MAKQIDSGNSSIFETKSDGFQYGFYVYQDPELVVDKFQDEIENVLQSNDKTKHSTPSSTQDKGSDSKPDTLIENSNFSVEEAESDKYDVSTLVLLNYSREKIEDIAEFLDEEYSSIFEASKGDYQFGFYAYGKPENVLGQIEEFLDVPSDEVPSTPSNKT